MFRLLFLISICVFVGWLVIHWSQTKLPPWRLLRNLRRPGGSWRLLEALTTLVGSESINITHGETRSPKKHETWKMTWGCLIDILIRMKGPSIKINMRKMNVRFTVFFQTFKWGLVYLLIRAHIFSKEIGMSHVFWDSLLMNHG